MFLEACGGMRYPDGGLSMAEVSGGMRRWRHSRRCEHTHTHSLSLSFTHSNTHSLSHTHSLTHTHSLSLSLTHTLTHSHSLTHTHTHSHTHTHTLTLTHSHTHTPTLSLSHTHTPTHTGVSGGTRRWRRSRRCELSLRQSAFRSARGEWYPLTASGQLTRFQGLLPESQGQNLALEMRVVSAEVGPPFRAGRVVPPSEEGTTHRGLRTFT